MNIGRELARHLARDTGLAPEDIAGPTARTGGRAEHLAEDAGVDPEDLRLPGEDPTAAIATVTPPD